MQTDLKTLALAASLLENEEYQHCSECVKQAIAEIEEYRKLKKDITIFPHTFVLHEQPTIQWSETNNPDSWTTK